jgi:hypothetical protein
MADDIPFSTDGWRFGGSYSYGSADLYGDIPHVVVNVFPESARGVANDAFRYLRANGVASAQIEEVVHVDGTTHFYVFAEREEFLSCRARLFPHVSIAPGSKR